MDDRIWDYPFVMLDEEMLDIRDSMSTESYSKKGIDTMYFLEYSEKYIH
jgi:hypothetical protein